MTRYEAFVGQDWKEVGMANVLVARIRSDGRVEFAVFLVDLLCLGVKDATYEADVTERELRAYLQGPLAENISVPLHPACAKKMIEGAVDYAAKFGFAPHRDYRKARRVLSGIDATTCPEVYEFGEGGQPCFVRGPNDDEERVDRVCTMLEMKCGIDGFKYVDPSEDEEDDAAEEAAWGARSDLMDWLDGEAEEVPRFYEVSGMMTAMQLCPEALSPALLVNVIWPNAPGLKDKEEAQDFLNLLMVYWNEVAGLLLKVLDSAEPSDLACIDVMEEDFGEYDAAGLMHALRDWAAGFLRATEIWPEPWREPLGRPALAPHWEIMRCFALLHEPGNLDRVDQLAAETPPRNLGKSVAALARALRKPMPQSQ